MKIKNIGISLFLLLLMVSACGESTEVVPSGTYEGTITEVNAEEMEIYVETEDGKELELYFTEETELLKDGSMVDFEALEQGQQVEVTVEKVGKRLDPVKVVILE